MTNSQRIAVVTGAARGLGFKTCVELARAGLHVILTARTKSAVSQALRAAGTPANMDGRILDVGSDGSVGRFFHWLFETHGRIDVLVNNAARSFGHFGETIAETPPSVIDDAFDNNALSAWRTIGFALPAMNKAGYGRIVNVSSGMGSLAEMGGGSAPYRISKVAMNAITRIAHAEAQGDVKVNSVSPGWVRTDMGGPSAPRSLEEGAAGIVWAATLPDDGPSGGFFRDGKPIAW